MPKLTAAPQFLLDMTNEELMNWNLEDETKEDGTVIPGMITKAVEWDCIDELENLLNETSVKKRYPRKKVWDEEKQKNVYKADKSKPQYETVSPVGFFEVKAKFLHDVCALPSLAKPVEPDFRAKIKAAAAKAAAAKAAAAKKDSAAEKVDAKMAEIFGKK